jgi:hypothetical protein
VLARRVALQRPCPAVAHRLYAAKRGSRPVIEEARLGSPLTPQRRRRSR